MASSSSSTPVQPNGNSVWTAMGYTPPRGRCNFKSGLITGTCSCLRYMLHPIKAATSFECDGCAHHASYHSMENPQEDAIILKWKNQEAALVLSHDRQDRSEVASSRSGSKRKRITDLTNDG